MTYSSLAGALRFESSSSSKSRPNGAVFGHNHRLPRVLVEPGEDHGYGILAGRRTELIASRKICGNTHFFPVTITMAPGSG
jgi:hypothetical protein